MLTLTEEDNEDKEEYHYVYIWNFDSVDTILEKYENESIGLRVVYSDKNTIVSDKQQTNSVLRAGSGNLDLSTQNLVFTHEDVKFDGRRMPIQINHIFNKFWAREYGLQLPNGSSVASGGRNINLGYGWKTNMHQYVLPYGTNELVNETADYEGKPVYVYIDASGTQITLCEYKLNGQGDVEIRDLKGKGLVYNRLDRVLSDRNGNKLMFNLKGQLECIRDAYDNEIHIMFNSNGTISKVTDNGYRTVDFEYDGESVGSGTGSGS